LAVRYWVDCCVNLQPISQSRILLITYLTLFMFIILGQICVYPGCRDRRFGLPKCRYAEYRQIGLPKCRSVSFSISDSRSADIRHFGSPISAIKECLCFVCIYKPASSSIESDYYWCSLVVGPHELYLMLIKFIFIYTQILGLFFLRACRH